MPGWAQMVVGKGRPNVATGGPCLRVGSAPSLAIAGPSRVKTQVAGRGTACLIRDPRAAAPS